MKTKWKLNYLIDGAMFLLMMAVAGIGLLMKYVLLPGREAQLKYGSQVEALFLGMDRHVWGRIHFIISLVLLTLLALHLILHWNQVVCLFRNLIASRRVRVATGWLFLLASVVLIAFPLLVKPELAQREPMRQFARADSTGIGLGRRARAEVPPSPASSEERPVDRPSGERTAAVDPTATGEHSAAADTIASGSAPPHEQEHTLLIQGYMSLREIAARYEVPESHILSELGITEAGAATQRLGWLRRSYGFTMSRIEEIIRAWWQEHPPSGGIPPLNPV